MSVAHRRSGVDFSLRLSARRHRPRRILDNPRRRPVPSHRQHPRLENSGAHRRSRRSRRGTAFPPRARPKEYVPDLLTRVRLDGQRAPNRQQSPSGPMRILHYLTRHRPRRFGTHQRPLRPGRGHAMGGRMAIRLRQALRLRTARPNDLRHVSARPPLTPHRRARLTRRQPYLGPLRRPLAGLQRSTGCLTSCNWYRRLRRLTQPARMPARRPQSRSLRGARALHHCRAALERTRRQGNRRLSRLLYGDSSNRS